ncbi:unnamed protein product (macronuclear) [Paramecium tetraurelia]|uniref:Ubiquitin-like domain-containing protein n=1 Tax=Paramecium tetraurelia TaxID=5888 RepID=A0D4S5_PARTE|nr:uncharacterized protein GSPATT00013489001 [Paramecium tetraurelia]CAK78042.1 unnamed protein product [Paramecium tetraurelia]|eukprot:XP_001445439.1 hypothetical protein (macronuclear) [Paramecium tetraurelia strain d4-2]
MSQDIVCTIEYPGGNKKFTVQLSYEITPAELIEEFKSQIVTNSNKIMLYCNQKLLDPNVPFRKQNVQNGATILMNVEVEGGGDF